MKDIDDFYKKARLEIEASTNRLLATIARKLRAAYAANNAMEIERIINLLESGLEKD